MAEALELRAITNHGYYTDYFLAYRATSGLGDLFKGWKEQEKAGEKTARSRVASLGRTFDQYRNTASELTPDEATGAVDASVAAEKAHGLLVDDTLAALGWRVPSPSEGEQDDTVDHTERGSLAVARGGTEHHIPVAYARTLPTGPLLAAVDLVFSEDPATVTSDRNNPEARLLAPATTSTGAISARTLHEVADLLFGCDTPPRYLLACSGATLILLDRDTWYEGAWLAVNFDVLLAAKDTSPAGETAVAAALFGTATLDPGSEPTNLHDKLRADAARHGAGVSKELRRGMRRAVEALAQAVVHDLHERQHANVLSNPQLDKDLTRQTLRYLYRLIVLLYAEAHPELGVLPSRAPEYHDGYGLERLRHLSGVRLESITAQQNNHIQQSLAVLFRAVNEGHNLASGSLFEDGKTLTFTALRSRLFDDDACPLIDRAHLPDETMQQVIRYLCFTEPKPGKRPEAISFATLDVPQIGAVYEGLMSWTGTVATELLYEVDRDGDPDNGSWTIPAHQADEYPESSFVKETDEHGHTEKVQYEKYDFVYRLAGRDRERAAAFYTPKVLTEFTIRHTLDEFFLANPGITADQLLNINICEPALGSGAFVNEAVTQLAGHYLRLRQDELGETIPAEDYAAHEQRAKAHFAINQAYGVDLNEGGIELAEVSLWLNCMHAGLRTPQLDARLRYGNSLIGARRSTYTADQVKSAAYTGRGAAAPTDQPLHSVPFGSATGIHHFLLPGEGWGAAADAPELKGKGGRSPVPGLAAEWAEKVNNWRRVIAVKPTAPQIARLQALAGRVEIAWQAATEASARFHASTRQHIEGLYGTSSPNDFPRNDIARKEFHDADSPAGRLRTLMNAWCAVWMWAPANGTALPTLEQWLDAAELLLGQPSSDQTGQLFTAHELDDGTLDSVERIGRARHAEILGRHPWLVESETIARAQAFFHWELEHAPVFQDRGGFDISVGNPPWVRPTWDEPSCLAEYDPWWGVTDLTQTADAVKRSRRQAALQSEDAVGLYRRDRAEIEGLNALLSAASREPSLAGIQTNLYMIFMTNTWRRSSETGTVGLLHPESHFVDPKAGPLRAVTYRRLRRHWQFMNEAKLFADVHNETEFGVNVYANPRDPDFRQAVNLLDPGTLDRSLNHDGEGELPAIQHPEGGWDTRPHVARLIRVDSDVLSEWVRLFDAPGTPPDQSRLLRPLTTEDLAVLSVFAQQEQRLVDTTRHWTSGFHEKEQKADGTFEWRTETPASLEAAIVQGPHVLNGTPFGQQPRPDCRSNKDWEAVDLEAIDGQFVPRTNFRLLKLPTRPMGRYPFWDGEPYTSRFREAHREFVGSGSVRTLQACILPPGVGHIYKLNSIWTTSSLATVRWTGTLMALPFDYLIKVSGATGVNKNITDGLPIPKPQPRLDQALCLRVLRLNCLLSAYESLWSALFDGRWADDRFVAAPDSTVLLGDVSSAWSESTPLRTDYDRWLALCEVDAIVALLLGLTEHQLVQMYRSQFPVLRKYEHVMVFDGNGRQMCGIHHAYGYAQALWEDALRTSKESRREKHQGGWSRVQAFLSGDTTIDLGPFVPPFRPADREGAMRRAYRAFEADLDGGAS